MTQKKDMLMELTTRGTGLLIPERYRKVASTLGQRTLKMAFSYTQLGLLEPGPSTARRIQAEMPVNEAKIGAQFVNIAAKTKEERITKLREAISTVGLPPDEIEEIDSMKEQVALGKKISATNANLLPLDVVDGIEKELVTRMEDVVKDAALPTEELDALKKKAKDYSIVGHGAIAQAMLDAETEAYVPDTITLATVNIARQFDTQPRLLVPTGWISEHQAVQAEHIMAEVPTRVYH